MRVSLRMRFALVAGALVLMVAMLVALDGYLTMRHSLLSRAQREASGQALYLARLVDVPAINNGAAGTGEQAAANQAGGNQVDISDRALTSGLSAPGFLIEVSRPTGLLIQASRLPGNARPAQLPAAFSARCLSAGSAQTQLTQPAMAIACERIGPRTAPIGIVSVGAPLKDVLASLAALRNALVLGVLGGALLAGLLALLLARRATRPIATIAQTAQTIRSGNLGQRIGYRGKDELGQLAGILDACFAELEEALERQRRFGADASHELRTPLAAIRANVELLRGWAGAEPDAREAALASLDQASRRASRLVEEMLYLAKIEREPTRSRAPVGLDELVVGVVREATPLRDDVAIRIRRLDEATVSGDALGLQQLMLNLLDNALRVSPSGGAVTVELSAGEALATITVSDQGPGIKPAEFERIFDRLYTGSARNGDRGGSGLGLAIARAIAIDHAGRLTARNNAAGSATFELTLPCSQPGQRKPLAAPAVGVSSP
jgi:signal transduction histidine kinase